MAVIDAGCGGEEAGVLMPLPDTGCGGGEVGVLMAVPEAGCGIEEAGVLMPLPDTGSGGTKSEVLMAVPDAGCKGGECIGSHGSPRHWFGGRWGLSWESQTLVVVGWWRGFSW